MSHTNSGGTAKYIAINYITLISVVLLAFAIGPLSLAVSSLAFIILGCAIALYGFILFYNVLMSFGQTAIWGFIICLAISGLITAGGIALATIGDNLMYMDNWPSTISDCLGAVLIIFTGLTQRKKKYEPYVVGTKYERRGKFFAKLLCFSLILGGVILLISAAGNLVEDMSSVKIIPDKIDAVIKWFGTLFALMSIASWTSYITAVRKALKKSGKSINDFKHGKSVTSKQSERYHGSSGNAQGGADEYRVRSEMESLANYFTGGFDFPYNGVQITYYVSADVSNGSISFMLRYDISGNYPQNEEKAVINNVKSLIQKRQKLILRKAEERLNAIKPNRDYNISIQIAA